MAVATTRRKTASPVGATNSDSQQGWRDRVVNRTLDRATKRSLERGQAFIDAATELLDETGKDGFTVQEVADRAGQSLRTLYQHFESKDDLLLAVFEEQLIVHTETVRKGIDKYTDPLDRLAALIVTSATPSTVRGKGTALGHYRMRLVATHPEELAHVQAPYLSLCIEVVSDAVAAGAIPECNPEKTAYIITTLKSSYLHSHFLGNELGIEMPTPTELARFCLEGVGAKLPKSFNQKN